MAETAETPLDRLWNEYGRTFKDFDDLTLARWMAQTLGQLEGRAWRLSHPLVGAYRLAAQQGHDRQVWHKRMATAPRAYHASECCRAPFLPLLTRDVLESGLICQHCGATAIAFDDIPADLQPFLKGWAEEYAPVHAVAHWEEKQKRGKANYDHAFEDAAVAAEKLLEFAGKSLAARLLEHYPAVVWEDQDECLEVRPEDIVL